MYNDQSSPTVTDCTFSGNTVGEYGNGGGMYNWWSSNPTVTNCNFHENTASNDGGGMYNYDDSSPTVTNCTFSGNTADWNGGGMHNSYSSPTVTNCNFTGNDATNNGGGIYNYSNSSPTVSNCTFSGNTAGGSGGAMGGWSSSPTVTNCTFSNNHAAIDGGGIFTYSGDPDFTNCAFSNNSANWGGAMYNYLNSNPTLTNCSFTSNEARTGGGGGVLSWSNPKITNCTFTGNVANVGGGGIYNTSSNPIIINCTFSGNSAPSGDGGGMYSTTNTSTLTNCILWGNTDSGPTDVSAQIWGGGTVTYSCVQGDYPGTDNIDADPIFLDAANGDLRLGGCSPCVDAGSNGSVPAGVTNDLAGNSRFEDDTGVADTGAGTPPIVDMGAYERQINTPPADTTFYVPGDYSTIQAAIGAAACSGNEIIVAPGTYEEAIDFKGKAIRLYSSNGPNDTIIDATGLNSSVVTCSSGEDANTILESFTITGDSGGMINSSSSPTVTNCTFSNNTSGGNGGAMRNWSSSPTVTNCNFTGNSGMNAGGIYNYYSSPTVSNCTFSGNTAGISGGAMRNWSSSPTVTNCTFSGNMAYDSGGGMINENTSNPNVTNCTFNGNEAGNGGGGMYNNNYSDPTVTNCTFSDNDATNKGGGMYNNYHSDPTVTNCTFSGNTATLTGGGMYNWSSSPFLTNCILWGNIPDQIKDWDSPASTTTVSFSDVHGGWPGAGNINIYPIFADAGAGDFRLTWYSPCVDTGDNNAPGLPATDLAGNPRVMDGDRDGNSVVDMGAYELEAGLFKVAAGTLAVTIEPNEAIDAGGKWKVEGGEQWYNCGDVVLLPPGYHKVEVNELPDWYEPETLLVGYDTVDSNEVPQQSLWVRVIGDMNAVAIAEYKPLPVFDIGQIPPRYAPHGRTLEFGVDANWLGSDVLFSFTTTFDPNYPEPEGAILIDPCSGLFTYEPNDAHDRTAFIVTFRAESGIDANEQAVKITPIPDLPLEYEIVSRPVHDLPDPCDHIFVNEILSDSNELLNGEYKPVRSVTMGGKLIFIEDVPGNPVYVYNNNRDINDLTIFAETLIIRDRLSLPQTNVTIYARDLYIEDRPGSITDINTTPVDLMAIPPGQETDGLPAGNISLYIESYEADGGLNGRFIMNGTKGYYGGHFGEDGVLTCTLDYPQPFAWLSPYALKMVIAHARDAYLYRYRAETHDMLSEYASLLSTYRALPEWNALPERWQFEFEQMHQEIIVLLHRLENGLDYFGNSPDWVPALSFEVLYTVYAKEIGHAIRVMYLSYWLQNKADDISKKETALSNCRSQLWNDTVQARDNYETCKDLIGPLKARANSIADKIGRADEEGCSGLLCRLKAKEEELLKRAQENIQEAHKVPLWKTAWSGLSLIVTSTVTGVTAGTIGGPYGIIGGGIAGIVVGSMNVLTDDSIMNPNPWQQVSMRTDVAKQFNSIDFEQATEGWMDDFDDIEDLSDIENNGIDGYLQNLRDNAGDMADGMWGVKEALKTTLLDDEEVEAKLKEIKASDPTFNRLVDEVTELMVEKQVFNRHLAAAMQKIATLANSMTNNVLAIDAMNRDSSRLNRIVNPRVDMYLSDMESRAMARLRKYHYYLAKAYEYRLLEPYPGDLNIEVMFSKMKDIAATPLDSDNGLLGPQDFEALKVIYEDELKQLTEHILTLFLSGRTEKNVPTWFEIYDEEELRQINSGEPLTINLFESGLFPSDKENIRIVDMKVGEGGMDVSLAGDCNGFGQIVVNMQHPAVSKLQYFQHLEPGTKNIYQFRHLAEDTKELLDINWKSEYNIVNGQLTHPEVSASQESLLWTLLGEDDKENALIYSRPGAWADITITKRDNLPKPAPGCPPCRGNIDYLLVRVEYDYYDKKADLQTLRVTTEPITPAGLSTYELLPYFLVDTADECGRQDGIGNFYRIYNWYMVPEVTVTASETYGNWRFDKWTDKNGYTLGYDPTLEFEFLPYPDDNPTVWAEYVYEGPILSITDFDEDYDVDFEDYAALSRVWLTEPADPEWDDIYDVSDPPDDYIDWRDVAVLCDYWLATP